MAQRNIDGEVTTPRVVLIDPERMNLLGLMLLGLLDRRLQDPNAVRHARALDGEVVVEASGMVVTLRFGSDSIEITRATSSHPCATVRGTLMALLHAALGRDRVRNFLRAELRAQGRPMALWHVLSLVRA
jgi:hypothetical protein